MKSFSRMTWVAMLLVVGSGVVRSGESSEEAGRKAIEQRLKDAVVDAQGKQSEAQLLSRYHSAMGVRLYKEFKYEQALRELQRAVALDPNNKEAQEYLSLTRNVLDVRVEKIRNSLKELSSSSQVAAQERLAEFETHYYRGRKLLEDAKAGTEPGETTGDLITRRMDLNHKALQHFDRCQEIARFMPAGTNLGDLQHEVSQLQRSCRSNLSTLEVDLRSHQIAKSEEVAEVRRQWEVESQTRKTARLADRLEVIFDRKEYVDAERLAQDVLKLDPKHARARYIYIQSRTLKHDQRGRNLNEANREEFKELYERLEQAVIPHSHYLVYSPEWSRISQRTGPTDIEPEEEPWIKEIKKKLEQRISFDFENSTLAEAIGLLRATSDVTFIIDPAVADAGNITLKVQDMPMHLALKWILINPNLKYSFRNDAVYIAPPDKLKGEMEQKVYDIRDLTLTLTHFPGPEFMITGQQPSVGTGATEETRVVSADSLRTMIQTRIMPGEWGADGGGTVEERDGRLMVMQRAEVHRLIGKFLKDLRDTQTLQVLVTARFIEVNDSFLEDIGIEWGGAGYALPNPTGNAYASGFTGETLPNNTFNPASVLAATPGGYYWGHDYSTTGFPNGEIQSIQRAAYATRRVNPFRTRLGNQNVSGEGLLMQFNYLSNAQANAILHAVSKHEKGDILTAPRTIMFNNQRGHIAIITQQSYVADTGGSNTIDPEMSVLLTGVVLDVKPTVSHDKRYITLEMRPQTCDLVALASPEVFTVNGIPVHIQLPSIFIRTVRTTVTVPDGGTMLISGLMTNVSFDANAGIPVISDLPILGRLFGTDLKQHERINLLILVSSNLILFSEEEMRL